MNLLQIAVLAISILAIGRPANAEQFFPPENEKECRAGSTLAWDGPGHNVRCADAVGSASADPTGMDPGWADLIRCKEMHSGWIENLPLLETGPDGSHVYALSLSGQAQIIFNKDGTIRSYNGWGLGGDNTCFHHTMQEIMALGWGYTAYHRPANAAYVMPLSAAD